MRSKAAASLCLVFAFAFLTGMAPAQSGSPEAPVDRDLPGLASVADSVARSHPEVPQAALQRALAYIQSHSGSVPNKDYVTVVDFNKASTSKRMYVINLRTASVDAYLSAHAENSGDNYPTKFSNTENSKKSSVGIYITGNEYEGSHGRSMRLRGMEPSNSNAEPREIVMHGADYVSEDFVRQHGRLGRSWGCPAVEMRYKDELVKKLEDGSVFYIYHSSFCSSSACHL